MNQRGAVFTILLIGFFVAGLILAVLFLTQANLFNHSPTTTLREVPKNNPNQVASSSASSTADVDTKLATLKQELLTTIAQSKIATSTSDPFVKEMYLYFGVNGSNQSTTWIDLVGSDIKFNSANYPGAKGFYFQASLQSDAPDRATYARVYDVGNASGVGGSDINYAGLVSVLKESSALSLASGNLILRVQIHSSINSAIIYNPRIKIVY